MTLSKHLFLFVFIFSLTQLSYGQITYQYNQAKAFNDYIGEGVGKWNFRAPNKWDEQDVEFTRVSLNKKDLMGNDLYRYDFKLKEGDECSLVPDNHFYPMAYVLMTKWDNKTYKDVWDNRSYSYLALGDGLIGSVEFSNGSSLDEDNKYSRIICEEYGQNNIDARKKNYIATGSFVKGSGKGTPFGNWGEFTKNEGYKYNYNPSMSGGGTYGYQYKGLETFYDYLKKYLDKITNDTKEIGYTKLMESFTDGDYFYYGNKFKFKGDEYVQEGNVKLKFEKKDGKLTNIIVQNSFDDGKFYDKEKFFINCPAGTDFTLGSYNLVPFDDVILVVSYYGESFNAIMGVFSKYPYDYRASKLCADRDKSFWLMSNTSEKYFCTTEFESTYKGEKDPLNFWTFIQRFYNAWKGK
jgi:hypothetical protein